MAFVARSAILLAMLSGAGLGGRCASADEQADLAKAGLTLGITLTKAIASALPPSPQRPAADASKQVLDSILADYKSNKATMLAGTSMARANVDFAIDATAIVAGGSGVGAVPAVLFRTAAQIASNALFDGMQRQAEDNAASFLASRRGQIEAAAGTTLEQLQALPPDELRERITHNAAVAETIRSALGNDVEGQKVATDLVINGIRNVSIRTLDAIAQDQNRMDAAEVQFTSFASAMARWQDETSRQVAEHSEQIRQLGAAVEGLQHAVAGIDARLSAQEANQAFVSDFVFGKMEPEAKAAALRSGFMAERFTCPPGETVCDGAALKDDLIQRFDGEARTKALVGKAGQTVQALADVSTIARNVGLKIPSLDQAVNYGAVAFNSFSQFAAGNYLGAVASLTGVLGHQASPEEERFKVLMKYLGQQFDHINEQLQAVQENQQKLMDAIGGMSRQLADYQKALDTRLDQMQFELDRVSETVRQQAASTWKGCYAIYAYVMQGPHGAEYRQNGDFISLDEIYELPQAVGPAVLPCLTAATEEPVSLSAAGWFGNFLSAGAAVNILPKDLAVAGDPLGHPMTQGTLMEYMRDVYTPAAKLLGAELRHEGLTWSEGMARLAAPLDVVIASVDGTGKPALASDTEERCGEGGFLHRVRLDRLLCFDQEGPDRAAARFLSTPMISENADSLAEWLLVASRLLDIYDQSALAAPVPREQLATWAARRLAGGGRDVVANVLVMMDAVVANYTVAYGEITARGLLAGLAGRTGSEADDARTLGRANGYVTSNAAMLMLWDHYLGGTAVGRPGRVTETLASYRAALTMGEDKEQAHPYDLLHLLFGDDLAFDRDATTGRVLLVLDPSGKPEERVAAALPEPESFAAGRLVYPPRMVELQRERVRVMERMLDYDGLLGRSSAEVATLVAAIAGERQ